MTTWSVDGRVTKWSVEWSDPTHATLADYGAFKAQRGEPLFIAFQADRMEPGDICLWSSGELAVVIRRVPNEEHGRSVRAGWYIYEVTSD